MKKKSRSLFNTIVPFNPWYFFFVFLISNTLLSYFQLSLFSKIFVGIIGIILPFVFGSFLILEDRIKKPFLLSSFTLRAKNGPNGKLPTALWFFFGFLVFFTRFYKLTSIPSWPISDEGIISTLSISLMKQWHWTLLWTSSRSEPLLIWLISLFFRIVPPSLMSLRLFPAITSILSALLVYPCVRPYLSRWLSFIFSWLFAFSFWEFSLMRYCTPEELILLFEILTLGCLGYFLKSKKPIHRSLWIGALISCNLLGFYSYVNWIVIWFFVVLVLAISSFQKPHFKKSGLFFLFLTIVPVLPLIMARLDTGGLSYIRDSLEVFKLPNSLFIYLKNLFYNCQTSFPYGPNWGGMFDPITSSLIFIGMLYAIEKLEKKLFFLLGFGLMISLLPGVLTNYVELHRVTPSLPFWILLAALGIQSLISNKSVNKLWPYLILLELVALGTNVYNFAGPYCDIKRASPERQWRSVEYEDAYQIIKRVNDKTGPLYIFTEFNTDYDNKTLNVAVYSFDCLQNPTLSKASPQWAVVITNIYYAPYFIKNFHGVKFTVLKSDKTIPRPFGIFLIPVIGIPVTTLENWLEADKIYRNSNTEIKNKLSTDSFSQYSTSFSGLKNRFPRDSFMTALYWEKYAFNQFLDRDFKSAAKSYQYAIRKGYPAAHLFYDLSFCLNLSGQNSESKKDFQQAIKIAKKMPISP